MTLSGKRVAQIKIKSEGDVFHTTRNRRTGDELSPATYVAGECSLNDKNRSYVASILVENLVKVDFMMSIFRSDSKYSDMFKEFESGGASGSGGCGDDEESGDDEDDDGER
ncbi:hypothetical protein Tco_0752389 [Tanacetum coccineum]|uniref:Uncharacterized protein n=1 Tax=Tanacetum coccineum TaxID=301880 RepID=A0ABQ4ZAA3_9ASTR